MIPSEIKFSLESAAGCWHLSGMAEHREKELTFRPGDETSVSMKSNLVLLTALACASLVLTSNAANYDFTYGYKTVLDSNANDYVVGIQNVRKYDEGTPGASYWAPISNDVVGLLTQRFDFSALTTEIHLFSQMASYNFGSAHGAGSLYGSTDGVNWELLLDNPTPSTIDSYVYYDQDVPLSLLGGYSFWLQTRLLSHNSTITAQSTHFGQGNAFNGFEINVKVVPEASTFLFGAFSALGVGLRRKRIASPQSPL